MYKKETPCEQFQDVFSFFKKKNIIHRLYFIAH
jgi:hypothetical protein